MSKLTVKSYYKNFLSIYGVLAAAIGGLPFLSKLLPEDWAQYAFPPLGATEPYYRVAVLVFAGVITLIVYFSKDGSFIGSKSRRTKVLCLVAIIALIGFIAFFILTEQFVRSIYIPSVKKTVVVSIGYNRTEFAQTTFDIASDEDMLRARGITEEEIRGLWTSRSILVARSSLFISYLIFILSAVAFFSLGVLFDKSGSPLNP